MKYWVSPTQTVPFKWYCPSKNRVCLFILKTFQVSSSPSFSCNFRIVNCGRNWFVWTHTLLVLCIRLPRYYSFSLTPALLWHFSGRLTTVLRFIKPSLWRYQLPPGNRDTIYLWGTGYSTKFSEWDTPLAISTLERKTLLTLSFFKIIQRQKYCLFCRNGHSQRGDEPVLEQMYNSFVLFFQRKKICWRGKLYMRLCLWYTTIFVVKFAWTPNAARTPKHQRHARCFLHTILCLHGGKQQT